jgi:sorting nexin-4
MDNFSDALLNAFSRVRKPDDRFLSMRESDDKFEEDLGITERLGNKIRSRTNGMCLPSPSPYHRI